MALRVLYFLIASLAGALTAARAAPPNVLVFVADDMAWGDLSLHGNRNLATPHLDSLAHEGARFERFYVSAVCAPTRAELLTGRYHPRTGVRGVQSGDERLNLDERTIADAFRAAGYATGLFGKWHSGSQWPYHPNARGFDEFYGFAAGHWGDYFDAPLEHNGRPVQGHGYIADDFTDHALAFIEEHRTRPFFAFVTFNTPHAPLSVPDGDWAPLANRPIVLRGHDGEREDLAFTRASLAMCENLDRNVGRVLRRLAELQLAEDTIVVFLSDNGPVGWRWNGGFKGKKGTLDEGGVRVPCFIRWPRAIKPDTRVRELGAGIDLLPTLAGLAGVALPPGKPLDGRNLAELLRGATTKSEPRVLFQYHRGRIAARSATHLLDADGALFDLVNDPTQSHNLAATSPEIVSELGRAVAAWRRDVFGPSGTSEPPKDDRPFPVGYREFPTTRLPADDANIAGTIKRASRWPNCSWFTDWRSTDDTITWDIAVETPGDYDVAIDYTCRPADVGATLELSFNGARVSGKVTTAWDPPLNTDDDRVPREEAYLKAFRSLPLGVIRLEGGRGPLTLRAPQIRGERAIDFRSLSLTLRPARGAGH